MMQMPNPQSIDFLRYEFSVFDNEDQEQAGGDAHSLEDVIREGRHYLAMYAQDQEFGPYKLEIRQVNLVSFAGGQP
jgi:hypothetical protein